MINENTLCLYLRDKIFYRPSKCEITKKKLSLKSMRENLNDSKLFSHFKCSPYQAVTGKIYRLKQHFLPPATA